jgi:hypothetical protein
MTKLLAVAIGLFLTVGMLLSDQDTTTEAAKVKPRWDQYGAAEVVRNQIRIHNNTCPHSQCFLTDPVLYAFNWHPDGTPLPARFKRDFAETISDSLASKAWFYESCLCWLVELRFHPNDEYGYPFWAWESNQWVESAAYNSHSD